MKESTKLYRFGSFELDAQSGELRKSGLRIKVEDQPFRLLTILVMHPGDVLTREELQRALWPQDTFVEFDHSLTRAINKVRVALSDTAANPRFIETLPKRGYRFIAPVSTLAAGMPDLPNDAAAIPIPPAIPAPVAPKPASWNRAVTLGVLAAAISLIAAFFIHRESPRQISTVAVLPFENVSGDPGQSYFADGMTEQVITALAHIRSIQIVSRISAMHYKGKSRQLRDIANELRVQAIVEGSVAVSGSRLRLHVRLIRLPEEQAVWTRTYERELAGVLALQTELARNIADEMGAFITPAEAKRLADVARPVNPELHNLYLQGRVFVNEPNRDSIERGLEALGQVIDKDPGNAAAWAAVSDGWFGLSSIYLPPEEAMPKAKAAALKALSIDPESDAAHSALGMVQVFYDWDWKAAEEQFRKAIEINPNSSLAYRGLGFLKEATGQTGESLQAIQRAIELDPMSLWAHFQSAMSLTCRRRHQEAESHARRVLSWEPRFGIMRSLLGVNLAERNQFPEAIRELEKAVELQRIPTTMAWLAQGYARAGRKADADRAMAELVTLATKQYVCPFEVATAFAVLGRNDEAFHWMNKAVVDRADCSIWLRSEPWLAPIHGDPRYQKLVRQIGFPQ